MQVSSYHAATFAPTKAAKAQPHAHKEPNPKPIVEPTQQTQSTQSDGLWENKSFSFWDILDVINPLQHIPVISTIYRKITGDEMGYASRIAGDTLYGGMLGGLVSSLVSALANVFVDVTTGKDIGEHIMASITPSDAPENSIAPTSTPTAEYHSVLTSPPATSVNINPDILPAIDTSRVQAEVDQYKWQIMADKVTHRSNHWV